MIKTSTLTTSTAKKIVYTERSTTPYVATTYSQSDIATTLDHPPKDVDFFSVSGGRFLFAVIKSAVATHLSTYTQQEKLSKLDKQRYFQRVYGAWTDDETEKFNQHVSVFEQIDEDTWQ